MNADIIFSSVDRILYNLQDRTTEQRSSSAEDVVSIPPPMNANILFSSVDRILYNLQDRTEQHSSAVDVTIQPSPPSPTDDDSHNGNDYDDNVDDDDGNANDNDNNNDSTGTVFNLVEITYRGGILCSDAYRCDYRYTKEIRGLLSEVFRLIIHPFLTEIDEDACSNLCSFLMEIIFHENIVRIGSWSFRNCRNLRRINALPEGLIRLGRQAFCNCVLLQGEIIIPESVRYIGVGAFSLCSSVRSVVFRHPRGNNNIVELEHSIFSRCTGLQSVTLPQNMQSIPDLFLERCSSLTKIRIPKSVKKIGRKAFSGCTGLRSLDLPNTVNTISSFAWSGCDSLECVTIRSDRNSPDMTIGHGIFINCSSLTTIRVYPWLWSKLFASMNDHPEFIFAFFQQYHKHILNFGRKKEKKISGGNFLSL